MIREIMKDEAFLAEPSSLATIDDIAIADDLRDTLVAHKGGCVGLAANMIGEKKRIIVFEDKGGITEMFNPEIIKKSGVFQTAEGCLSLTGTRETKRFASIKVQYQTREMQMRFKTYKDWEAQIIQHEIDHCNGIII